MKHPPPPWRPYSAETAERLNLFAALLLRWNARINLIARSDLTELWTRHIEDSAQLAAMLGTEPTPVTDLGSGAGFPGLIIAIMTGWRVNLIESDQRKAAFLREAARQTEADVAVHAVRIEQARLAPALIVTARALAPLTRLLELAHPLLRQDGFCLFPKGATGEDELTAAARQWHMQVERIPSHTSPDATIFRLSEIRRAGPPDRA